MEAHHEHCMSCVNQRCTAKPQVGVSCDLVACSLVCGAVFHSCKATEHQLLCTLERVPCLNSGFGCPIILVRKRMSAHLEVCPAGLVCCTMEWNRWPVSCVDYTSYESLSRGVEDLEQLDMALALQDQRTLLESLKVVAMAPTKEQEMVVAERKQRPVTHLPESGPEHSTSKHLALARPPPPGSAKERIANGISGLNEERYSQLYEATVETARSLAAALDVFRGTNSYEPSMAHTHRGGQSRESADSRVTLTNGGEPLSTVAAEVCGVNGSPEQCCYHGCLTGSGVFHGNVLKTVGSACPVTGQVNTSTAVSLQEPSGFQPFVRPAMAQRAGHVVMEDRGLVLLEHPGSEHRFHEHQLFRGMAPFSVTHSRRGLLPDCSPSRSRPKMEDRAVDTSDLEQEDDPMGLGEIDPIAAALLFCLEESRECRRISDRVYVDSHHVDFGTQTFTFPATILVTNTRVGDMASASACDHAAPQLSCPSPFRTLRLGLVLEALEVEEVPHGRYLPLHPGYQHTFSFVCGQSFRRDQFSSHSTNVHGDIHAGLNGWMERRCPLAYYGCTFSQRRLYPATRGSKVVHDRRLRSFGVLPRPGGNPPSSSLSDQFSGLPMEIMWHIAGFLDSFSLCQLSVVSRTMRDVCASLLQTRGMVELQWERRQQPPAHGTVSWHIKNKVWKFSTAFGPVSLWGFSDLPSMSDHLRKCRFNIVEPKTEPVPLPAMCTTRDRQSLRRLLRPVNK